MLPQREAHTNATIFNVDPVRRLHQRGIRTFWQSCGIKFYISTLVNSNRICFKLNEKINQIEKQPNGTWTAVCQHGQYECYGNIIQACALEEFKNDTDKAMEYVHCSVNYNIKYPFNTTVCIYLYLSSIQVNANRTNIIINYFYTFISALNESKMIQKVSKGFTNAEQQIKVTNCWLNMAI